jgi:F-type H+-transporting ATPase subunit b
MRIPRLNSAVLHERIAPVVRAVSDRLRRRVTRAVGATVILSAWVPAACAAEAAGEQAHSVGLRGDLPFWSLVTFVGFVWVIRKLLWKGFIDGLTERERKENAAIADAESSNVRAQEDLAERRGRMEAVDEEIAALLAEAKADAGRTRDNIIASAELEAQALQRRAVTEILRSRDQALHDIFSTFAERVTERTGVTLRGRLTPAEHQRLIDDALGRLPVHRTRL